MWGQQPGNLNVRPGSNALFTTTAKGISPITFQWRFNGVILPDETNATLTVLNAQSAQVGRLTNVQTNLQFIAASNRTYCVQAAAALDPGANWHSVADVSALPTNRIVEFVHPITNSTPKFSRIATPRSP